MKKIFAALLGVSVCICALASCSENKNAPAEGTTTTKAESAVTIKTVASTDDAASPETTTAVSDVTKNFNDAEESSAPVESSTADATETAEPEETSAPAGEDDAPVNTADISAALTAELEALKTGNFAEGSYAADTPFASEDDATYAALFAKFDYTVGEVTVIDSSNATVKATVTMVDLGAALMAYMNELNEHADEENWDEDFSAFYEILSGDDAVLATNNVTVNMVKTESGWAVSEDNDELKNAITGSLSTSGLLS